MKDVVSFSDFTKLDLRVGKVISAESVDGSRNLIRMAVDLGGDYGVKKILAGVAAWYKPEDLKGKKFIFVANLEPKQMMKEMSNGMMLACCNDKDEPILLPVDKKVSEGTVVR